MGRAERPQAKIKAYERVLARFTVGGVLVFFSLEA